MKKLSEFTNLFSVLSNNTPKENKSSESKTNENNKKENPQSQVDGIADDFIKECLNNYFSKH